MEGSDKADQNYHKLIGSLLYIGGASRTDIFELSHYPESLSQAHMKATVLVLRYRKGTIKLLMCYKRGDIEELLLTVFADASWGSDLSTRRSMSGTLVIFCGAPVIYKSKRQKTVALSSAEAENMDLSLAALETMWLRHLLQELGAT